MSKTDAKQAIVEAFIAKVEAGTLRSIHVSKLIAELGINRNTFYYHFPSKVDVALYVFRCDFAHYLEQAFPPHELVRMPADAAPGSPAIAYYAHREIGARTLDFSDFYKALIRCVLARPRFYCKLFTRSEPEFRSMFDTLYRPAVEDDLRFVLGGRYMPPSTFDWFAYRYTGYLFDTARYCLKHARDAEEMLDDAVNPFWNMPHEALVHELQMHSVARPRHVR